MSSLSSLFLLVQVFWVGFGFFLDSDGQAETLKSFSSSPVVRWLPTAVQDSLAASPQAHVLHVGQWDGTAVLLLRGWLWCAACRCAGSHGVLGVVCWGTQCAARCSMPCTLCLELWWLCPCWQPRGVAVLGVLRSVFSAFVGRKRLSFWG